MTPCEVCLGAEDVTVVSLDPIEVDSGEDVAVCEDCAEIYGEQRVRIEQWMSRLAQNGP